MGQTDFPARRSGTPDLADGSRMEILCACDERFLPHTATMLSSLLTHNCGSRIHFFHSPGVSRERPKPEIVRGTIWRRNRLLRDDAENTEEL